MSHTTKRLFEGHDSTYSLLPYLNRLDIIASWFFQLQIGLPCFVGKGWHMRTQSLPGSLFPSHKRAWGGGYSINCCPGILKDHTGRHGGIIQHHHRQYKTLLEFYKILIHTTLIDACLKGIWTQPKLMAHM